jgi:hypothetical protein
MKYYNLIQNKMLYEQKGKRRVMPQEIYRRIAHESTEGGVAKCHFCRHNFSMNYIVLAIISSFKTDHVCRDCFKSHNLQKA